MCVCVCVCDENADDWGDDGSVEGGTLVRPEAELCDDESEEEEGWVSDTQGKVVTFTRCGGVLSWTHAPTRLSPTGYFGRKGLRGFDVILWILRVSVGVGLALCRFAVICWIERG